MLCGNPSISAGPAVINDSTGGTRRSVSMVIRSQIPQRKDPSREARSADDASLTLAPTPAHAPAFSRVSGSAAPRRPDGVLSVPSPWRSKSMSTV